MAFITLEGGDGGGKSTQIALLKERLPKLFPKHHFVFTKEPGGTPFAQKIRELLLSDDAKDATAITMLDLLMASRFDHVEHLVAPELEKGSVVISDRFVASSYAYQVAGEESAQLLPLYEAHYRLLKAYWPDLIIVLEVDPALGLKRVAEKRQQAVDHFEKRNLEFHTRIKKGFRMFKKLFKPKKMVFIDANRSVDEVYKDVSKLITAALK